MKTIRHVILCQFDHRHAFEAMMADLLLADKSKTPLCGQVCPRGQRGTGQWFDDADQITTPPCGQCFVWPDRHAPSPLWYTRMTPPDELAMKRLRANDIEASGLPRQVIPFLKEGDALLVALSSMLSVGAAAELQSLGVPVLLFQTGIRLMNRNWDYATDLYSFSTLENGMLNPRGAYSVIQQRWREKPVPVKSWKLKLPAVEVATA